MLTEGWLLMLERDDSVIGFCEISLIYFGPVFNFREGSSNAGCLTGILGDYCFFMFDGGSTLTTP